MVVERHAFSKGVQEHDETIVPYIVALGALATTCEFADNIHEYS